MNNNPSIITLPNDLLVEIYSFLEYKDLLNLPKTNKYLYSAIGNYKYQQLLKIKYNRYVNDLLDSLNFGESNEYEENESDNESDNENDNESSEVEYYKWISEYFDKIFEIYLYD